MIERFSRTEKISRIIKLLLKARRDKNLSYSIKSLLHFLTRWEEIPPQEFSRNIKDWSKNIAILQKHQYQPQGDPPSYGSSLRGLYGDIAELSVKQIANFQLRPTITIMTPLFGPVRSWTKRTLNSLQQQFYPHVQIYLLVEQRSQSEITELARAVFDDNSRVVIKCSVDLEQHLASVFNEVLEECSGEFVGFLSAFDVLTKNAVLEVVRLLNYHPELDVIYSDEARKVGDEVHSFIYKPGWSRDLFLSFDYIRNFLCCKTEMIRGVGGFRGRFENDIKYDLLLRLIENTEKIGHIPEVLYHEQVPKDYHPKNFSLGGSLKLYRKALSDYLARTSVKAEICDGIFKGSFRVRREITGRPRVSIIIPTKDKVELLKQCIDSIESKSTYTNYEIIVIDNGSTEPSAVAYLTTLGHQIIHYPEKFNFSKINNLGAAHATGDHLLFLNNDTQVIAPGWIEALLEHSQREEVGAVGAKLLYPTGLIQHAGVVLGSAFGAAHINSMADVYDHGYQGMADVVRNFSAVTGACLMMRACVFKEVGGFEEDLAITYNDTDLCLKARAKGYLIVYTPYALLYHYEGISRLFPQDGSEMVEIHTTSNGQPIVCPLHVPIGQVESVKRFFLRWQKFIENDSNYSPNRHLGSNAREGTHPGLEW